MSPPVTAVVGQDLAGRYRLEASIGTGGAGAVFRARDARDGRLVAIKVLRASAPRREELARRMEREARVIATLRCPSTVRLLDFGATDHGEPFLVSELSPGGDLRGALERGSVRPRDALAVMRPVLASLAEAHRHGIVHRDVKPSNVLLDAGTAAGPIKLADYGAASAPALGAPLTQEGDILGTPAYMAPEQIDGAPPTAAADVYAAGLMLAELVGGEPVYRGPPREVCFAKLRGEPPPFNAHVRASAHFPVIERATRLSPGERYPDASAMLDALSPRRPALRPIAALAGLALILVAAAIIAAAGRAGAPRAPSAARASGAKEPCLSPDELSASSIGRHFPELSVRADRGIPNWVVVKLYDASGAQVGAVTLLTAVASEGDPDPDATIQKILRDEAASGDGKTFVGRRTVVRAQLPPAELARLEALICPR